jgi:hypothetical protein
MTDNNQQFIQCSFMADDQLDIQQPVSFSCLPAPLTNNNADIPVRNDHLRSVKIAHPYCFDLPPPLYGAFSVIHVPIDRRYKGPLRF